MKLILEPICIDPSPLIHKTPLQMFSKIGDHLGINLFVKRDDLYPLSGGGNKARKLKYILNDKTIKNYNAIVSAGSNQSNHLRATAISAAMLGWKTICVVHDIKPNKLKGNLKITNLTGAELRFVKKEAVKQAMDNAMDDLKENGYNPLYIWGGGHCVEGSLAYYEAVKELKEQLGKTEPNFIFLASGTGTTQAGIETGIRQLFPYCEVIGISVARDVAKGKKAVLNSIRDLYEYLNLSEPIPQNIKFDDQWMGDGYEAIYPELRETIEWAAKTEGLILDPTYTGKAFHALKSYIQHNRIPKDSNVIFWHTGGLLNLMASDEI